MSQKVQFKLFQSTVSINLLQVSVLKPEKICRIKQSETLFTSRHGHLQSKSQVFSSLQVLRGFSCQNIHLVSSPGKILGISPSRLDVGLFLHKYELFFHLCVCY